MARPFIQTAMSQSIVNNPSLLCSNKHPDQFHISIFVKVTHFRIFILSHPYFFEKKYCLKQLQKFINLFMNYSLILNFLTAALKKSIAVSINFYLSIYFFFSSNNI